MEKKKEFLHSSRYSSVLLILLFLFISLEFAGCGGAKLIPRDLKDYVSHDLKIERRRVELTQPFRTRITLRVEPMPVQDARQAVRDLIESCIEYYQRDNITDFINDTLVYKVRLDADPDVNIQWWTVADDMRMAVNDEMNINTFYDRCRKEENWVGGLE